MARVDMKRDLQEEPGTPEQAPETIIYVKPRRETDPVKKDKSSESGKESARAPEVIDADWVEARDEKTAPNPPASEAGVASARLRMAREKSPEFSFVNYVLLFFSAALLSALVMLAVMGQL